MLEFDVRPLSELDSHGFAQLLSASEAEGFRFVRRLIDDWNSGQNRFDGPGEGLWGAYADGRLIGVAGLNASGGKTGRIRRFFVLPEYRRAKVGSSLMATILEHSVGLFDELVLRTDGAAAHSFYQGLGFKPDSLAADVSHRLTLRK